MKKDLQEIIDRVDELYRSRTDLAAVHGSVDLLEDALRGVEDYELYWRLSRSLFFLGQEEDRTSKGSKYFQRGADAAEAATSMQADLVAGQFWLGVNLVLRAQVEGLWIALTLLRRGRRTLTLAKNIDETFHGAGPLRVLGRTEHKVPRLLGGSRRRARECYERALTIAPHNTVTRMFFAELLIENREIEIAKKQLKHILAVGYDAEWEFEIARDQIRAAQMLQELA